MSMPNYEELSEALRRSEEFDYDEAWSMSRTYYTDPDLLARERAHLFATEWICIGRGEEVAESGSFMSFRLCDEPLVAVRGEDAKVRVFSNVCRPTQSSALNASDTPTSSKRRRLRPARSSPVRMPVAAPWSDTGRRPRSVRSTNT